MFAKKSSRKLFKGFRCWTNVLKIKFDIKISRFSPWNCAKLKHSLTHEIFINFTMLPNWIFLSLKLQKHSSTDCFSFLVLHIQLLGHFCHLTDSKNVCLTLFHELFCRCRAVLRRKEINFTALLHKSAYDYLTLTLKLLCSAMRLSLGNIRKKSLRFFSSFPDVRMQQSKKSLLNSSSLSADEAIFHSLWNAFVWGGNFTVDWFQVIIKFSKDEKFFVIWKIVEKVEKIRRQFIKISSAGLKLLNKRKENKNADN